MAPSVPHLVRAGLLAALLATPTTGAPMAGSCPTSGRSLHRLDALARHPQDGPDADVRIRVEDDGVTFRILMNLAFLDAIAETPREAIDAIHPSEVEGIRLVLYEFLRDENRVVIDGVQVTPIDVGFEVGEPELNLLPLFPKTGMLALLKVQITLEYPATARPGEVELYWAPYPIDVILMQAFADDVEDPPTIGVKAQLDAYGIESTIDFSKIEPGYTWHDTGARLEDRFLAVPEPLQERTLALPVVSIGIMASYALFVGVLLLRGGRSQARTALFTAPAALIAALALRGTAVASVPSPFGGGPSLPTEEQALEIFQPLHANIYNAFAYSDESDVYDALARSVHGDLLRSLYDEIYRGLILQEEGGAVSRVKAVRPLETELTSIGVLGADATPGFEVDALWQVDGVVHHWGHSHWRTNEYRARYSVRAFEEGWRIVGSQTLEQRRIDAGSLDTDMPAAPAFDPRSALTPQGDL